MNNSFFKTLFLLLFVFSSKAESKTLSIGEESAKVTIKVLVEYSLEWIQENPANILKIA